MNLVENFMMGKEWAQRQRALKEEAQSRQMLGQMMQSGQAPEGLAELNPNAYMMGQQYLQQQQQAEAQRQQQMQIQQQEMARRELFQNAAREFSQNKNPEAMTEMILADPDMAKTVQQQLGVFDDSRREELLNKAFGYKQAFDISPDAALEYYQTTLAGDPTFQGLQDNVDQGDMLGALNEIQVGVAALGGSDAIKAFRGQQADSTPFIKEMVAAGVMPGSEEFKNAVIERYGKGSVVAFDTIEALNPDTGKKEFFRVNRTEGGPVYEPIGLEVPPNERMEAARAETEAQRETQNAQQLRVTDDTVRLIDDILKSPGLKSWSGIQSFVPIVPGTSAANTDAYIEQLKSKQFLEGIDAMRGMGALSNAEGQKISAAAAALDRRMTDEAVELELRRIKEELNKAKERLRSGQLIPISERGERLVFDEGRGIANQQANAVANQKSDSQAMSASQADAFINGVLNQ